MAVALGLDWVTIDAEHGHLDWKEIVEHVRAAVRRRVPVRLFYSTMCVCRCACACVQDFTGPVEVPELPPLGDDAPPAFERTVSQRFGSLDLAPFRGRLLAVRSGRRRRRRRRRRYCCCRYRLAEFECGDKKYI